MWDCICAIRTCDVCNFVRWLYPKVNALDTAASGNSGAKQIVLAFSICFVLLFCVADTYFNDRTKLNWF